MLNRIKQSIIYSVFFVLPMHAYAAIGPCSLSTGAGINFGNYTGSSDLTVNGSLTSISCNTDGTGGTIYILSSANGGSANPYRTLNGPGGTINYNLYVDSGYNTIWGNGVNGGSVIGPLTCTETGPSTCTVSDQTIYGKIPSNQLGKQAGNYNDSISVVVSTSASGTPVNGSFTFGSTVAFVRSCTLSATGASLGSYNSISNLSGSATLTLSCNQAGSYQVGLQSQNNPANTTGVGIMRNGANGLMYQMYQPSSANPSASCSSPPANCSGVIAWGNGPSIFSLNNNAVSSNYNACLCVPSGQSVPDGSYSDTVSVQVNF